MGVVYRAHDDRLQRDVALKLLPAGTVTDQAARTRFRGEALALSRLNHPNIATIFDFDTRGDRDFIVMELIPGCGLDEKLGGRPLPEADVRKFGMQLAEALIAAHAQGVIHADLKPGNIRLTEDGRLKVLDFGLARIAENLDVTTSNVHLPIAGTLAYMAPEQLQGKIVDERTDIYAAGAVLYEMATGKPPFTAAAPVLAAAILSATLNPPSSHNAALSSAMDNVIMKALDRDANRRYQSARELLVDLERSGLMPGRPQARKRRTIDSIAVLPFVNDTGNAEADYLSDGITEALISRLAPMPKLRVLARSTVFRYKGSTDPVQAGSTLNVGAVLAGRLSQHGNRLTISAELIDVGGGWQLWGAQHSRESEDILSLQDEIATTIVEQLRLNLSASDKRRLTRKSTSSNEAYELYLRGRFQFNQFNEQGIAAARRYFEHAIEKDSEFALAYAGLADCYYKFEQYGVMSSHESRPKARKAAESALLLDNRLAEAHAAMAVVKQNDWDWQAADNSYCRAIKLNPNFSHARHMYSHMLMALGRVDESLGQSERALASDPLEPSMATHLGWHLYFARQYEQAVTQLRNSLELHPSFRPAHDLLGFSLLELGRTSEALAVLERGATLHQTPETLAALGYAYAISGRTEDAQAIVKRMQLRSRSAVQNAYFLALVQLGIGDLDRAMHSLEVAFEQRESNLIYLNIEPKHDPLRTLPAFQELVSRMRLV